MSTITSFNRIDDCDKIDAQCIDGYSEFTLDDSTLCVKTPWGEQCIDIEPVIKAKETLTTMYLSPEENPNCLVYEPERGDNICIHGDDLSRIISMTKLKDVDQDTPIMDGGVYVYDAQTGTFKPYDLMTAVNNINTAITNINAAVSNLQTRVSNLETTIANHEARLQSIEAKLTPPTGSPSNAKVLFGNINIYSDYNAVVNSDGVATSLDRTHGVYGHSLNSDIAYDELMG